MLNFNEMVLYNRKISVIRSDLFMIVQFDPSVRKLREFYHSDNFQSLQRIFVDCGFRKKDFLNLIGINGCIFDCMFYAGDESKNLSYFLDFNTGYEIECLV